MNARHINKEPNITCDQCGIGFYKEPSRIKKHRTHYCSRNCYDKNKSKIQSKKQIIRCLICDKEFEKKLSKIKKSPNHYCSITCSGLSKKTKITVNCLICNKEFEKELCYIKRRPNHLCSKKCSNEYLTKERSVQCSYCNKSTVKKEYEILRYKNHFCSRHCLGKFINKNKTYGYRRSKLECYLEKEIEINYPNIKLLCNKRNIVGLELDLYFPDLNLAIELNGPTHYQPIYGQKKFEKIQNNDKRKSIACYENGIELAVIDTSSCGYLNEKNKLKFKTIVFDLIDTVKNRKPSIS